MRYFVNTLLVLLLISTSTRTQAAPTDSLSRQWDVANAAYINADYSAAAKGYEAISAQGVQSGKLYLNLGNAYFKQGMNGKALLNYHRAHRLAPTDEDIQYNLMLANAYVQDKIETVPTFVVKRWVVDLRQAFTSNTWAVVSIFLFSCMLICAMVYLLVARIALRKVGFYGGVLMLLLFVVAVWFASLQRQELLSPSEAIVMLGAAPVKSAPDASSKELFVLHEGTKVKVNEQLGDYREITIADGNKGWILSSSIELID